VSSSKSYWFHCGRCGNLFQGLPGLREDRRCSHCGFEPSTGVLHPGERRGMVLKGGAQSQEPKPSSGKPTKPTRERSAASQPVANSRKPGRKRSLTTIIAGAWFGVLVLVITAAKLLWPERVPENTPKVQVAPHGKQQEEPAAAEDMQFQNDESQAALEAFSRFIGSSTPEERSQYVLKPIQTAVKMDRFYRENSMPKLDPTELTQKQMCVVHLPDGRRALHSLWEHRNGQVYDSLMVKEDDEWKIDWEHFVRYASEPFSMFMSGNGDAEGEFRLLVRERLAEERKDLDAMSLVFYTPRFGRPREEGLESPEISVSRSSPEGKLLSAALHNIDSAEGVFRSRIKETNPDRMARVRVVIKRSGTDTERSFQITRVLACHWFSVDHPGLELPASK
jgi:hypothetical protein